MATKLEELLGRDVPDDEEARIAYVLRSQLGQTGAQLAGVLTGKEGDPSPADAQREAEDKERAELEARLAELNARR